jgi:hypothetical protein
VRIVVGAMLAGVPRQGGATWAALQWVLGLRRLGHEVLVAESVDDLAAATWFERVAREFGLEGDAALVRRRDGATAGLGRDELLRRADGADLLLNLGGRLEDDDVLARIPRRAYVDLDPAFTQLWHEAEGVDLGLDRHDRFVTLGWSLGEPDCALPTCGRDWIRTLPPVVLRHWPVARITTDEALTTVGHWRSYGSITHRGVHYGQKAHALRPLIGLPARAPMPVRPALGIHRGERADLSALRRNGWQLLDPDAVAATPAAYRDFVAGSWAELGIAKLGYVASRCGWFSDRSACYLASGRPVVAQDTGFGAALPTGDGLLAFSDEDGAVVAIERVLADYQHHRTAARRIAEDLLDSDIVLSRLLEAL